MSSNETSYGGKLRSSFHIDSYNELMNRSRKEWAANPTLPSEPKEHYYSPGQEAHLETDTAIKALYHWRKANSYKPHYERYAIDPNYQGED